jgi:Ca2+-binding RTX toxin-like protein
MLLTKSAQVVSVSVPVRDGFDSMRSIENLTGSNHDDTLIGSGSKNNLSGRSGVDQLFGLEGPDHLVGGPQDDALRGELVMTMP